MQIYEIHTYDIYTCIYTTVFPEDPYEQLYNAIFAVFDSWTSSRAIKFRQVGMYIYICMYMNI
jgi:hypothetical protein